MRRALVAATLMVLAGCQAPLTQVVLVIDSDLVVPDQADFLSYSVITGGVFPTFSNQVQLGPGVVTFPATLGLLPVEGVQDGTFTVSITVMLVQQIVVARRATDVHFVHEQERMLLIMLPRACACHGTSCPGPDTPGCEDLENPTLAPLDSRLIQRARPYGAQ